MLWLIAAVATVAVDVRVPLVELQLDGRYEEALVGVDTLLARDSGSSPELGLSYLQGDLLVRLGRAQDASTAFARTVEESPVLAPYARYRLAQLQAEVAGHPETAAGLVAKLLSHSPPRELIRPSTRLLAEALEAGGDCLLLASIDSTRFPDKDHRRVEVARASCEIGGGSLDAAKKRLIALLRSSRKDEGARAAAELLSSIVGKNDQPTDIPRLLGMTFQYHRQFERALFYLEETVRRKDAGSLSLTDNQQFEVRYGQARSHFWKGNYSEAADLFGATASWAPRAVWRAQSLYQKGRCEELTGNWSAAVVSYQQAYLGEKSGRWAGASLLSALRLLWRAGQEDLALTQFELLAALPSERGLLSRGALFLAASDIVRGRDDRAEAWLDRALRAEQNARIEVAYWRGRHAELQDRAGVAIAQYLTALRDDPYHPIGQAAEERLNSPELVEQTNQYADKVAASRIRNDLHSAWILLGSQDARGIEARQRLEQSLAQTHPKAKSLLGLAPVAPAEWPLWRSQLLTAEEQLLALGVGSVNSRTVLKHFPRNRPELAYTASQLLAAAANHKSSISVASTLIQSVGESLPESLLPAGLRRLLFPLPHRRMIDDEAKRYGTDPFLVAGVIREESRFDERAFSNAAARGLTQFVIPTATRLAREIGLERFRPEHLDRPAVAIQLGAAYLAELAEQFGDRPHVLIAAYNAGEDQAQLWQSYCYSLDPAEYYTKVGFTQTRNHVRKVLRSREQYAELYGSP